MDYYKPPVLFRQNAIKKARSDPGFYLQKNNSSEKWLLKDNVQNDILNKTCSLNKIKIASNYWRIPDDDFYLTAVSVNQQNPEQIAIASGKHESNLFIYDMNFDQDVLTHQQTVSLPNIESMEWLDYDKEESSILTGHKNGVAHMVSIPESNSNESARILKRFNHKKHFTNDKYRNSSIKNLDIPNWNKNSFLSLCNENIFLWDLNHRSDLPILKNQHLGIRNFDSSLSNNGIVALCGEFGIALNDLRAPINTPSIFTPKDSANMGFSNSIKWAPYDSNILAASHVDGVVRLWDIRAQRSFAKLKGHNDLVTSIEWSEESSSDLYTGSRDGNIIHWDLDFDEDLSNCCLNEGLDSINFHKNQFLTDDYDIYNIVNQRQCGTLIPAAKDSIIGLTSTNGNILSIDGSSYLGVHRKRGIDSFRVEEGTSAMIIDDMLNEIPFKRQVSNSGSCTLTDSSDEESIFEQSIQVDSAPSTANNSPVHVKTRSITKLLNNSDHSVNTLVGSPIAEATSGKILKAQRSTSGSTINDDDQGVCKDFTYEKVLPLNRKLAEIINMERTQQMQYV